MKTYMFTRCFRLQSNKMRLREVRILSGWPVNGCWKLRAKETLPSDIFPLCTTLNTHSFGHLQNYLTKTGCNEKNPRGVVAKVFDVDIVVIGFDFQLRQINTVQ